VKVGVGSGGPEVWKSGGLEVGSRPQVALPGVPAQGMGGQGPQGRAFWPRYVGVGQFYPRLPPLGGGPGPPTPTHSPSFPEFRGFNFFHLLVKVLFFFLRGGS